MIKLQIFLEVWCFSKRIPLLKNTLTMKANRTKGLNMFNVERCSNGKSKDIINSSSNIIFVSIEYL